jgi:hypothetical protein
MNMSFRSYCHPPFYPFPCRSYLSYLLAGWRSGLSYRLGWRGYIVVRAGPIINVIIFWLSHPPHRFRYHKRRDFHHFLHVCMYVQPLMSRRKTESKFLTRSKSPFLSIIKGCGGIECSDGCALGGDMIVVHGREGCDGLFTLRIEAMICIRFT